MRKSRGNCRYLYSHNESSPGRDRNVKRPKSLTRLVKDPQGCVHCFAIVALRSTISKWATYECRLLTFSVLWILKPTLGLATIFFKALEDLALTVPLQLAKIFPSISSDTHINHRH